MTALTLQTFLLLGVAYLAGCMLACVLRRSLHAIRSRETDVIEGVVGAEAVARAPAPSASIATVSRAPSIETMPVPAAVALAVRPPPAPLTIARNPAPATPPLSPTREGFRRADTLEPPPQSRVPAAAPSLPVAAPLRGPAAIPVPSAPAARVTPPSPPRDAPSEEDASARFRRALDGPGQATARPTGAVPTATAGPPVTPKPSTALPAPVVIAPKTPDPRPAEPRTALPVPEMTPQPRPPQNVQTPPPVAVGTSPASLRSPMIVKPPVAPTPPPTVRPTPAATVVSAPPTPSRPIEPARPPATPPAAPAAATPVVSRPSTGEPAAKAPAPGPVPVTTVAPRPIPQDAPAKPMGVAAPAAPPIAPAPVVKADAQPQADDLKRIKGIDEQIEAALSLFGVTRYAQIAAWRPEDVARLSNALKFNVRIEQENWIEQAQILARGEETAFSRQLSQNRRGAPNAESTATPTRAVVVENQPAASGPPTAQGVANPAIARPMRPTNDTAAASAAAVAAAAATRSASQTSTPSPQALGLSRPAVAAAGTPTRTVTTPDVSDRAAFARSATLSPQRSQPSVPTPPQAPSNPTPAHANEPARTTDLSNLRSVRSESFRPPNAPSTTAETRGTGVGSVGPGRFAVVDDLKRIRGIGVLIEKKLNSMGITGYEEIANWSSADIDRVSQVLDFKGRIERENWVEQARILAVGGQTEFSRRSDRGE